MQIKQIQISGFGVWHGLTVEQLSPTITVMFGQNEAGKSTLLHFLRSMLYGQDPDAEHKYLPPVNGGDPGGSLRVSGALGRFKVFRRWHEDGQEENVWIEASDGSIQSRAQLDALLEGVDRLTYSNIFAVGLREMQLLATLDDSVAAQKIYELTSGLDRISLAEVMRELESSRQRLISGGKEQAEVDRLLEQHVSLKKEIEQLRGGTQEWSNLLNQRRATQTQADQLQHKVHALESEIQFGEMCHEIRPEIKKRDKLVVKIEGFGELPSVSRETHHELNQLLEKIARKRTRCRELRAQYYELREQHAEIPVNTELNRQAARVDALGEHRQWILSLTQQLERGEEEASGLRSEIEEIWEQTGIVTRSGKYPDLSPKQLRSLKEPLKTLERESEALVEERRHIDSHQAELAGVETEVEQSLSSLGEEDLTNALDKAGQQVNLLRRRIQVEDKIDQIKLQYRESEGETHDLLEEQVAPKPELAVLGLLFVGGISMVLHAMFGDILKIGNGLGFPQGFFGSLMVIGAFGWKRKMDNVAAQRFDSAKRQLMLLDSQMDKAIAEKEELDRSIPRGNGALMARLKSAEEHLHRLEELIPLGNKLGEVRQKQESNSNRISEMERAVTNAKKRWRDALLALDLPHDLDPDRVKTLGRFLAQISQHRKRLREIDQEHEIASNEREALQQRIVQLAKDVGVDPKSSNDPLQLLSKLEDDLIHQEGKQKRRTALHEQGKKLRDEFRRLAKEAKALIASRERILEEAESAEESEYMRWIEKSEEVESLELRLEEQIERIETMITQGHTLEEVELWLSETPEDAANERLAQLINDHETAEKRMKECFERRGELKVQLENLEKNDRLLHAQLEMSEIEAKLEKAITQWQTLATTSAVLEQIRRTYETERQPETLRLASTYMEKLTDGRYGRIWTPLHENTLFVEENGKSSKALHKLSEGTREQVFLSVRLALIRLFARQGRILPVILDDVLVNFDSKRSRASAELFKEFADQGHQLLIFTCHEHIAAMFQCMGADVRQLPKFTGTCRPGNLELEEEIPQIEFQPPEPEPEPVVEPEPTPEPEPEPEPEPILEAPPEVDDYDLQDAEEIDVPVFVREQQDLPEPLDVELPIVQRPLVVSLKNKIRPKPASLPVDYRLKSERHVSSWRFKLEDFGISDGNVQYHLKDAVEPVYPRRTLIDEQQLEPEEVFVEEFPVADAIIEPEPVYTFVEPEPVVEFTYEPEPDPEPEQLFVHQAEPKPKPPKKQIRYIYDSEPEFGWDSPRRWYEHKDPRKDEDDILIRTEVVEEE